MPRTTALLFLLLTATAANAQTPQGGPASQADPASGGQPVTLQQTVEPSFRIEPVVQRFNARRGAVVPFAFAIGSLGKEMNVSVQPVKLRQEETGIILHRPDAEPDSGLKIKTPARFRLAPGDQQVIAGELTVPIAKSNYLSHGILVREEGAAPKFEDTGDASTKAGIRFVTQYVLRVDVETGVADAGSMGQMRIERAKIVADHGLPKVVAYLNNPTDYAFECFVSAKLPSASGAKPRPIKLGMLSRASLDGAEKHLVRIMPGSRLRLEAPINELLNLGPQTLSIGLSSGRRQVLSADFEIDYQDANYPALARRRVVLGGGVAVTPAQLELGTIKQAKRTVGVKFANTTNQPIDLTIEPLTLAGELIENVRFSPSSFSIKAGRTKGVRATLRGKTDAPAAALARITLNGPDGPIDQRELPLALLHSEPAQLKLDVSPIAMRALSDGKGFVVTVINNSDEYVPLTATLAVVQNAQLHSKMEDGYGVWLAPNESRDLVFRPGKPLTSGEYTLALQIETREQFAPITRELNVVLTNEEDAIQADATRSRTPRS